MIPSHAKATAAAGLMWLCFWGSAARAQEASDPGDRAYQLFQESVQKYRQGRFEEAAELLEEANRLDPDPILVYNLARAYEGMGDFDRAVGFYEQYLRESPEAADRGAVEARVETLRREIRERARLRERERQETPGESSDTGAGVAPWFLVGLGAASVGVGAVFGILSTSAHSDAEDAPDFTSAYASQQDAEDYALGANVAFAVGLTALAVGAVWLVLELAD